MVEIDLIVSAIQIASTGLKLSTTLNSFAETVSAADETITHIAKDASLTAAVLSELGSNLGQDKQSGVASTNALTTAEEIAHECKKILEDIDVKLGDSMKKASGTKYSTSQLDLERLRWPFLQLKMELLRSNLERPKSTLILMVHVLTYAAKTNQKSSNTFTRDFERLQIDSLIRANQRARAQFESLNKSVKDSNDQSRVEKGRASTTLFGRDLPSDVSMSDTPTKTRPNPSASPFVSLDTQNLYGKPDQQLPNTDMQVMSAMDPATLVASIEQLGIFVYRIDQARSILTATKFQAASIEKPSDQIQYYPTSTSSAMRSQGMTYVEGYACRRGGYKGGPQPAANLALNLDRPWSTRASNRNMYTFDTASTEEKGVLENFRGSSSLVEKD